MKTDKITDPLDTLLKEVFLEDAFAGNLPDADSCLRQILLSEAVEVMPGHRKTEMLNRLQQAMLSPSLGRLLQEATLQLRISDAELTAATGLSGAVISELKQDITYPNSIPVMLFKKLLTLLNIPFRSAAGAIRRTFELLQSNVVHALPVHLHPAYKKGNFISKDILSAHMTKSSGKELFQNEESLGRYLNRLEQLMNS